MEDCLPLFSASHSRYHTASDWHNFRAVPCGCTRRSRTSLRTISHSLVQHLVPVPMLLVTVSSESGYTASWVVGHQLLTMEAQNQFERNPCEICGRQTMGQVSLQLFWFAHQLSFHWFSTLIHLSSGVGMTGSQAAAAPTDRLNQ